MRTSIFVSLAAGVLVLGCGGGGSSGGGGQASAALTSASPTPLGSATSSGVTTMTAATPPSPVIPPLDVARLSSEVDARRRAYLQASVAGFGGQGENVYTQIARVALGQGPIDRASIERDCAFVASRQDTADMAATALLRLWHMDQRQPLLPPDLRQRIKDTFLGWKFWIDEPGRDTGVYWSENHQCMYAAAEYLAGQAWPTEVFSNTGMTGDEHRRKALVRLQRWFRARGRWGMSEWSSPVYYPHDLSPLFNLVDFAQEPEVRARAAMVVDLIVFDLARLTHRGSFGVTAGRAYAEHKVSGHAQSVGDLIEVLFASRGGWRSRGSTAATPFATSAYRVPHALLAIAADPPASSVQRARVGLSPAEAPSQGVGFQTFEDGMFWWGQGAYMAPETIEVTHRMLGAWDLWSTPSFSFLAPLRWVPAPLLPGLSSTLSPLSEGSILAPANTYAWRTPDAMLSSVQSYRPGKVGFQQHAWQATLSLDACVWTTAPGNLGHDGPTEWTGSASLPRVVQVERALVALYNPGALQRTLFPTITHAFFPRAAFDEVVTRGSWTFAREDDGYVALHSARPAVWTGSGPWADKELHASGARNVWLCLVGRRADDGPFADFMDVVERSRVVATGAGDGPPGDPLGVVWDAPGVGTLEVDWRADPRRDGATITDHTFPRFDTPWGQTPWGSDAIDLRHPRGPALRHDHAAGVRAGDGV